MGRRLVVLAAIFQHSPAIILVARRADISNVSELRGRTLMDAPGNDEILAMLKHEGVDYSAMPRVAHRGIHATSWPARPTRWSPTAPMSPSCSIISAPHTACFRPEAYGIDFYGDNLCTSRNGG